MNLTADRWMMYPFSTAFNIMSGLSLLLLISAGMLLRRKSEKTKQLVLVCASLATLVFYFIYKHMLSIDAEYSRLIADLGGFSWWGELPLQLCNINMLLMPAAVLTKNRALQGFAFFAGPIGAFMALVLPGRGFDFYPLFLPRIIGYYGTHFLIMIEGLALGTFGLFRPRFRDMPRTAAMLFAVGFCVFLIDVLFRISGLYPHANYFYAIETEGNFLLEIFHQWIPLPFLYLLPSIGILCIYMMAVTLPFEILDRMKK